MDVCCIKGCESPVSGGGMCGKHSYRMGKHGSPLKVPYTRLQGMSVEERFNGRIYKHECGCWLWTAYRNTAGYGVIGVSRDGKPTTMLASRLSWELHRGEIPSGMFVCHKCDTRACVNPDHLFLGTVQDNVVDMDTKGRRHYPSRGLVIRSQPEIPEESQPDECCVKGCNGAVHARGVCKAHHKYYLRTKSLVKGKQLQLHGLTLQERLYARRNIVGECWNWTGSCIKSGYGQIWVNGKMPLVTRVSWEMHRGPIPDGLFVCHKCDNPKCFNPDHLFLGTAKDNSDDKHKKGRANNPAKARFGEQHGMSKLTLDAVREIRSRTSKPIHLAEKFGVSERCIEDVLIRKTWKHVP